MPKINVYLPDDLAAAVKAAGLPVSPICQHALEQAVRKVNSLRESARHLDLDLDDPTANLPNFTERARVVVRLAVTSAREAGAAELGTEHLLAGILAEGHNLALRVLRALEIEPEDLAETLAERIGRTEETGPVRALTGPATDALEQAVNEAISLGHNYIGCEHLLLGLIAEQAGTAGELLRSLGADQRTARRAVAAALTGFAHAQRPVAADDPAALLRVALAPLTERLDRLEARLTNLESHPA